jgi:hypothetical protein
MSDIEFWFRFGVLIFSAGSLFIMMFVSILIVEYKEYKKRKNKK